MIEDSEYAFVKAVTADCLRSKRIFDGCALSKTTYKAFKSFAYKFGIRIFQKVEHKNKVEKQRQFEYVQYKTGKNALYKFRRYHRKARESCELGGHERSSNRGDWHFLHCCSTGQR